jgi:hypothetical protein
MNVIQFFTLYWDWYLLVGLVFAIALLISNPLKSSGLTLVYNISITLLVTLLSTLVWPILATATVLKKLLK